MSNANEDKLHIFSVLAKNAQSIASYISLPILSENHCPTGVKANISLSKKCIFIIMNILALY
jgi:hypothetical protein